MVGSLSQWKTPPQLGAYTYSAFDELDYSFDKTHLKRKFAKHVLIRKMI